MIWCFRPHMIRWDANYFTHNWTMPMKHPLGIWIMCGIAHYNWELRWFFYKLNLWAADEDGGELYWNWPWIKRYSTGIF